MSKKVTVKICTGTTCYVMGGAFNLDLEKRLPAELLAAVDIEYSPCLGFCQDIDNGQAPFAEINGTLLASATPEKIKEALREAVNVR